MKRALLILCLASLLSQSTQAQELRQQLETLDGILSPRKQMLYRLRAGVERLFAWVDVYRTLLVRFERRNTYWMGWHYLAFALVNLRHQIH